jgi:hypothetical protein
MAGRFTQLGYAGARFRFGEGGHGWGASLDERFEWMKGFSLNARPPRVRLKTDGYRHGRAYWVELTRMESRMKNAFIDIEVVSPAEISLHAAEGVERMRLDLRGLGLVRDVARLTWAEGDTRRGVDLPEPTPDSVELVRSGAGWAVYTPPGPEREAQWPPSKKLGLEGPIYDCFREPFLIVVGTTAKDGHYRRVVREEAGRLARNWRSRFQCWPPIKDDSEVTEEDIRSRSLVLFGGPGENSVAARALATGRLPVSFGEGSVTLNGKTFAGDDIGVKLCYPNPLAPDRMLVLFAATGVAGMWQSVHRFGNWFDWMPLSNLEWCDWCVFDSKTQELETMLDVGFFDEDWRPSDALRWGPIESWRARAERRILPRHDGPPKGDTVRLSELWPESIDTLRGNVRIDRSMNGGPLCIGRTPQPFGLGVWIESAVTYDLDGAFRRFTVDFGIDAEGQETTSAARAETERTVFEVLADGKVLERRTGVSFGDPPGSFDLDVTGVRHLTLRALRSSPKGWLYGPVCWGSPTLRR